MKDVDFISFVRALIEEAGKLNTAANTSGDIEFTVKMTASQVCASMAQALLNARKAGAI